MKQPHAIKCGAKTRSGESCKNYAMANGRCRMHGGKSTGAPKQNKNAVKTGEYESIIFDVLEEEEKELYYKINLDKLSQLNNEIKLTDIRLRRMMLRIKELKEHDYTVVSYKIRTEKGKDTNMAESEGTLGQIQSIEDAITRVQAHKAKLIDLKHKLELDMGLDDTDKENILDFLKATRPTEEELSDLFEDEDNEEV